MDLYELKELEYVNSVINGNKIGSFTVFKSKYLLVSVNNGNLLIFSLQTKQLLLTINKLSTKRIDRMDVIAKWGTLIYLSDYRIYSCKIEELSENKIKFSKEPPIHLNEYGIYSYDCHTRHDLICIGMKRRALILKRVIEENYFKFLRIIELPKTARSLSFNQNNSNLIWIGFSTEYGLYDINTGTRINKETYKNGTNRIPFLSQTMESFTLCNQDDNTRFFNNYDFKMTAKLIRWSAEPIVVVVNQPFIIGLLKNKTAEVFHPDYMKVLQVVNIDFTILHGSSLFNDPRIYNQQVSSYENTLIIQGKYNFKTLNLCRLSHQIDLILTKLPEESRFLVSLSLIDNYKSPLLWANYDDSTNKMEFTNNCILAETKVNMLYSIHLFRKGDYKTAGDCLRICYAYSKLNVEWIFDFFKNSEMFEDLNELQEAKQKFIESRKHTFINGMDIKVPDFKRLDAKKLTEALRCILIPIVSEYRREINLNESRFDEELKIIDKLLYKAYLLSSKEEDDDEYFLKQRNRFLVNNYCMVKDCEKLLLLFPEFWENLVWIYYGKYLHKKCLLWLKKLSISHDDEYIKKSVQYLQRLDFLRDREIIVESSKWILKANSKLGIEIFTNPKEVNYLDNGETISFYLNFLREFDQDDNFLEMRFLKFLTLDKNVELPDYHNRLALILLDFYLREKDQKNANKLEQYLREDSTSYNAAELLPKFREKMDSNDKNMLNFEAILLNKMGLYFDALNVIYKNKSIDDAIEYCNSLKENSPERKEVFLSLFKMMQDLDAETIIEFLNSRFNELDPIEVIGILSNFENITLRDLNSYLESVFKYQSHIHKQNKIVRQLLKNEHVVTLSNLIKQQKKYVLINENTVCSICKRKFQPSSAFVRQPDGTIMHYSCYQSL